MMLTFSELGKYGRLGNQMFQIASTIGLATRHGYSFGFPYWMNYDHLTRFGSSESIDIQSYFKNPLPKQEEKYYQNFPINWGYHNYNTLPDNLNLMGHMQSEKYFEHCKDTIRHYFEFKHDIALMPDNAVALHVRRGDYDNLYHPCQGLDYYEKALSYMPTNAPIFVFSDEPEKARELLGEGKTYITGNHYMTDLQIMTKCTHFILSNSTLCWWGWWLSKQNGVVVAPLNWFGKKYTQITAEDIYTEKMILI